MESKARHYYGDLDRPLTKIYDTNAIEHGNFVEVMILLLREVTHMINDNEEIDEFVRSCDPYLGKPGVEIEPETAQQLLDRFMEIYES